MTPVDSYCCLGSGAYVGQYFLRNTYRAGMKTPEAALLAIQALAAAKDYDPYTGGTSTFLAMNNDGSISPLHQVDVYHSEVFVREFERIAGQLLFTMGDFAMDDRSFQIQLGNFTSSVKAMRHSWKLNTEAHQLVTGIRDAMAEVERLPEHVDNVVNRPEAI